MVATTDQNSGDIKKIKVYAEQEHARLDKQLRLELNAMARGLRKIIPN